MNISFDVISYMLGALGIAVSIIFYFKGRREKKPIYLYENIPVIGSEHSIFGDEVKISFKDTPIKKLSMCRVTIRNIGGEPIRRHDIPESDPLKIYFDKGTKILSAKIKNFTKNPIKFEIFEVQDNSLGFTFDFLDKNDGALIEIIHDGSPSQKPQFKGTIIGAPHGFEVPKTNISKIGSANLIQPIFMLIFVILLYGGFNKMLVHIDTSIYPIAPSVADSVHGKELIKRASNGDRSAVREIRRLSGLSESSPLDTFEWTMKIALLVIFMLQVASLISQLKQKKYYDLMLKEVIEDT